MRLSNQQLGQIGEDLATAYLRSSGFVILDRNFRSHRVELDIVAREKNTLVFCEVKTRRTLNHGLPIEAITAIKMEHIRCAALAWLGTHRIRIGGMRFDAIGILYGPDGTHSVSHIRGVDQ
jgi:putative endonuclease